MHVKTMREKKKKQPMKKSFWGDGYACTLKSESLKITVKSTVKYCQDTVKILKIIVNCR